jgi:hypothetical protein
MFTGIIITSVRRALGPALASAGSAFDSVNSLVILRVWLDPELTGDECD